MCLAFADGQGLAFEGTQDDGDSNLDVLGAWFRMRRQTTGRAVRATADVAVVRSIPARERPPRADPLPSPDHPEKFPTRRRPSPNHSCRSPADLDIPPAESDNPPHPSERPAVGPWILEGRSDDWGVV